MAHYGMFSADEWALMAATASRMAAVSAKKAKAQVKISLVKWADECAAGHGTKGHAYCRDAPSNEVKFDAPAQQVNAEWKFATADEAVARRAAPWFTLWGRDQQALQGLQEVLEEQRALCIRDDDIPDKHSVEHVEGCIKKLKSDAAAGVDDWSGRELKHLPTPAVQELTELLHQVNLRVAWPAQTLKVIVVLLLNPKGVTDPFAYYPNY